MSIREDSKKFVESIMNIPNNINFTDLHAQIIFLENKKSYLVSEINRDDSKRSKEFLRCEIMIIEILLEQHNEKAAQLVALK